MASWSKTNPIANTRSAGKNAGSAWKSSTSLVSALGLGGHSASRRCRVYTVTIRGCSCHGKGELPHGERPAEKCIPARILRIRQVAWTCVLARYQDWQPQASLRAANVFAKLVAGPGGKLDMHTSDVTLTRCQVADGGVVVPRREDAEVHPTEFFAYGLLQSRVVLYDKCDASRIVHRPLCRQNCDEHVDSDIQVLREGARDRGRGIPTVKFLAAMKAVRESCSSACLE